MSSSAQNPFNGFPSQSTSQSPYNGLKTPFSLLYDPLYLSSISYSSTHLVPRG